jgi:hypothetical protein
VEGSQSLPPTQNIYKKIKQYENEHTKY